MIVHTRVHSSLNAQGICGVGHLHQVSLNGRMTRHMDVQLYTLIMRHHAGAITQGSPWPQCQPLLLQGCRVQQASAGQQQQAGQRQVEGCSKQERKAAAAHCHHITTGSPTWKEPPNCLRPLVTLGMLTHTKQLCCCTR